MEPVYEVIRILIDIIDPDIFSALALGLMGVIAIAADRLWEERR